jgi:hypothetical protein
MLLSSRQTLAGNGVQVGFPQASGLVCHRIQFYLMLYLLPFEKRNEKEKRTGSFFPGQAHSSLECSLASFDKYISVKTSKVKF